MVPAPKTEVSWVLGVHNIYPRCSVHEIFTYIWLIFMIHVGKYAIHGCYGYIYIYLHQGHDSTYFCDLHKIPFGVPPFWE